MMKCECGRNYDSRDENLDLSQILVCRLAGHFPNSSKEQREAREAKSGIERVVFLLLHTLRDQIMQSDVLDKDDKLFIAKFYDDHRGRGW